MSGATAAEAVRDGRRTKKKGGDIEAAAGGHRKDGVLDREGRREADGSAPPQGATEALLIGYAPPGIAASIFLGAAARSGSPRRALESTRLACPPFPDVRASSVGSMTRLLSRARWFAPLLVVVAGCAESPEERRWDIYELARDPTPANIARIRAMLDDPDRDIRATALNKLVGLGVEDAEPIALAGLDDEDGFVRSIAAKRLGDLGSLEHTDRLIAVVAHDPDPRARETAVVALEAFASVAAIEGLILGLDDPMSRVRLAAVNAVRRLAPERAKAALARLVLEDSSWEIRVQAAGALGRTGDTGMVPVLEAAEKDESELVRSAAARALTQLER
jgi:hypothetical protein